MSFPSKPTRLDGFDKPVSWLAGRDLLAGLKWIVLYSAFKGKLDARDWMKAEVFPRLNGAADADQWWRDRDDANWRWKVAHDKFWQEQQKKRGDFWTDTQQKEFWFDFIADSGDGQVAVYNVAYLCLSDLWTQDDPTIGSKVKFEEKSGEFDKLLPRGQFLFVGGDTAYHIADYTSLSERFQIPFRWAFAGVRRWLKATDNRLGAHIDPAGRMLDECRDRTDSEPDRPLFGIPGNHDYYDFLDGFNRQFREPALEEHATKADHPQLSILGFERCQNASYAALQLPFDWWLWALDTEVSKLDARQQCFFLDLLDPDRGWLNAADDKAKEKAIPKKLILATPEPTTVFRKRILDDDKTIEAYGQLGLKQPFEEKPGEAGKCRLDLSGDVHHYARYHGPNTKKDSTHPVPSSKHYASVVAGGGGAFMHPSETRWTGPDVKEEQVLYPPAEVSHATFSSPLFDLRNIFNGGYVWLFGMIVTGVIYFALTIPHTSKDFLEWILQKHCDASGKICIDPKVLIPFAEDADLRHVLPPLGVNNPISLKGFVVATILLILPMFFLGVAIFILHAFVERLRHAPSIGLREGADNLPTRYRDLWAVGLCVLLALASYLMGIWICLAKLEALHPFGVSLTILIHIVIGVELLVLSVQNSAWLAHRPKLDTGNKFRFLPVWGLTILACLFVFFGIWAFGRHPGAYILSDVTFALVAVGLFVALVCLGIFKGGELQRWPGKIVMGVVGFWHAILQLTVAFALVRIGDWRAVLIALGLILIFSGLSIPYTRIAIDGLGAHAMRRSSAILIFLWVVYGAALLTLPLIFHRRGILSVPRTDQFSPDYYSSFLPPSVVNWLAGNTPSDTHAWTLEIISLFCAVGLGFLLSMSFLSWYFAVAMVFQGHNNEVGGAGRVEKFRHILRICLTKNDLTCYVIAFDEPKVDGDKLDLKLVDKFTLTVT